MAAPSIRDIFLAYRQAKLALYFERRGVGLLTLATFERALADNLTALHATLSKNGGWFDGLPLGKVWVVPKKFRIEPQPNPTSKVTRIGIRPSGHVDKTVDVQVRYSPSPAVAIVEVLYLWQFGPPIEGLLSDDSLGYRLDLRNGALSRTRRWLFQYWPKKYQAFRTAPLAAARVELRSMDNSVVIVSADLASFYDTVDPSFLLHEHFLGSLRESPLRSNLVLDEYQMATRSLLAMYQRFRQIAARLTGLPWRTGIPIGALTSRLVANAALATLDRAVVAQPAVFCYRRYVDDLVIVARVPQDATVSFDDALTTFIPHASIAGGDLTLDAEALNRPGSEFALQPAKIRVHHLRGPQGDDFIAAIQSDFQRLVSEGRAFLDSSVFLDDVVAQLVQAQRSGKSPLRVLRDADRVKLEHFALSNSLRSLERISSLVELAEVRDLAQRTLNKIRRFLGGEDDWVESIGLGFRLLSLGIGCGDWNESISLSNWMDSLWGTVDHLRASAGTLSHRGRTLIGVAGLVSMRNYLHARRIETIASALRPSLRADLVAAFPEGLREGTRRIGARALIGRARLLAMSDLRLRDREDDRFELINRDDDSQWQSLQAIDGMAERFDTIRQFTYICAQLGDAYWQVPVPRLFLSTRPPSYFDIARRWLYRTESHGFDPAVFDDLLAVVNAVRGTEYWHPLGRVIGQDTVEIPGAGSFHREATGDRDPRIILGNLVVDKSHFIGAATRVPGSRTGRPVLSAARLRRLSTVLSEATRVSRLRQPDKTLPPCLLGLPELSIPRDWFRAVADYVIRVGKFGLVAGLEYLHDLSRPVVLNQAYAVLPGPFSAAATWPWTKRLPARQEATELNSLPIKVSFLPRVAQTPRRTVVHSPYGRFSVLICSEMLEARRTADLLGRVELVLVPSWNRDTASYDHLVKSVATQLHAIIAIANNGHYSDSRAWAPLTKRWERDLCRLVQRNIDTIVFVDIPLSSMRAFHADPKSTPLPRDDDGPLSVWRPLPPEWP